MENLILKTAVDNLLHTVGIHAVWKGKALIDDGILEIELNGEKSQFSVEIKNEIRPYQIPQLEKLHLQHKNLMVVANRIFPKVKEEFRQKGIPYLEANGNLYLKKENILLYIDSRKPIDTQQHKTNRAFTKTGLKVLFHLLLYKDDINIPQRHLAEKTGVGLGNIPQIIDGLKEIGFLIPLNKKEYIWENRKGLLDRWVDAYGTNLKPSLTKFQLTSNGNWQGIQLDVRKSVWGGEPGADILTNHLRPQIFTLYTKETKVELMKKYFLIPSINGEIEALEMFWNQEELRETAPPILIYADLILEGGKRNIETAEMIFNEYIQPKL